MIKNYAHLMIDTVEPGTFQPSAAFEQLNKISGIAEYYNFPFHQTADEYDQHIRLINVFAQSATPEVIRERQTQWHLLTGLNPQLLTLDIQDMVELRHAIHGVASLFNPDDIQFYIDKKRLYRPVADTMRKDFEYAALREEALSNAVWPSIQWVPSPKTLNKIIQQLQPATPSQ
ncbi:MAG: hypothetical protein CMH27_05555 [Micavibrio sp.]|nr:hypothetical protein [Micavibrio sp.]|tara:strand:+ start:1021 stop:1542 length:522 start_codon:yes stop_codon:yes gene_type:complete